MNIICLGDSLTFGYGVWRNDCWVSLIRKATGLRVLNRGTNGDTSAYMLQRARRRIVPYESEAGDISIIMGGANDVLTYGASEDDSINIITIAELFRAKNCTPIIGIQPGFKSSDYAFYGPLKPDKLNADFHQFAENLLANAKAAGITVFDLRPVLSDPSFFQDGIHPTKEGHKLIADTVLAVIKPLIHE